MKRIMILLMVLIMVILGGVTAQAATSPADMRALEAFAFSEAGKSKMHYEEIDEAQGLHSRLFRVEYKDSMHHTLTHIKALWVMRGLAGTRVEALYRVYTDLVSPGKQYTEWITRDRDMDGVVDQYIRDYAIVGDDDIYLFPEFPDGLINKDWYRPGDDVAQKEFDKEIAYWMDHLEIGDHKVPPPPPLKKDVQVEIEGKSYTITVPGIAPDDFSQFNVTVKHTLKCVYSVIFHRAEKFDDEKEYFIWIDMSMDFSKVYVFYICEPGKHNPWSWMFDENGDPYKVSMMDIMEFLKRMHQKCSKMFKDA